MLIKFSTNKTVPEVIVALTLAVPGHHFNIIRTNPRRVEDYYAKQIR